MAGTLFLLARVPPAREWSLAGGPYDRPTAEGQVAALLEAQPHAIIVVANAARSFRASVTTREDGALDLGT